MGDARTPNTADLALDALVATLAYVPERCFCEGRKYHGTPLPCARCKVLAAIDAVRKEMQ